MTFEDRLVDDGEFPVEIIRPPGSDQAPLGSDAVAAAASRDVWTGCPYCLNPPHSGPCQ